MRINRGGSADTTTGLCESRRSPQRRGGGVGDWFRPTTRTADSAAGRGRSSGSCGAAGTSVADRRITSGRSVALLERLSQCPGGARLLSQCTGRMDWPRRGVYFFLEPNEVRTDSGTGPRVVSGWHPRANVKGSHYSVEPSVEPPRDCHQRSRQSSGFDLPSSGWNGAHA